MRQLKAVRNQRKALQQFFTASDFARIRRMSADAVRYDVRVGKLAPAAYTASGHALFSAAQAAAERRRAKWEAE